MTSPRSILGPYSDINILEDFSSLTGKLALAIRRLANDLGFGQTRNLSKMPRYIDIAVNLTDDMFTGLYRGKQLYESDLDQVVQRAKDRGVERMIITGTSLKESRQAVELAIRYNLHATVGCHPTSTSEIESHDGGFDAYMQELEALVLNHRPIAIGEIGLDYDRLHHSPADLQMKHFPRLLALAETHDLPLFLHSRHPDAHRDFVKTLEQAGWKRGRGVGASVTSVEKGRRGVVHSFTGTKEEMEELLDYGLYIGVNGCSLKTEDNLNVVRSIPLERLMLETDAPWCSITSTAASHAYLPNGLAIDKTKKFTPGSGVKGRNEPGDINTIAHVVASVKGLNIDEVADAAWNNTIALFWPQEIKR